MKGKLIAIDGIEGSGRTSHAKGLSKNLEYKGYGVINLNIEMSKLFGDVINKKKKDIVFETRTLFLGYATALADLNNYIKPLLDSGFIVIFDGYINTLKSWGLIRNIDNEWMDNILSLLIKPDINILLYSKYEEIIKRIIKKNGFLDPLNSSINVNYNDLYDVYVNYIKSFQDSLFKISEDSIKIDTMRSFEDTKKEIIKNVVEKFEA